MNSFVSRKSRFVVAGAVVAALVTGSVSGASAASSSGSNGTGGGAFSGDTIVATAWENVAGDFSVELPPMLHPEDLDVYHYRVGVEGGAIIDFQPTEGLDSLTEAEQSQWYVDAGLAPYEFEWLVFYCPEIAPGSAEEPTAVLSDPSITLDEIVSRSVGDATGFPTFDVNTFFTWHEGFNDGSAFEPEIGQKDFLAEFSSNVQTELLNEDDLPYGQYAVLAGTYLDFSCPTSGNQPMVGRILNSSQPDDFAVNRSLTIGDTIFFQGTLAPLSIPTVYTIPSAGSYIGVTGRVQFDSNAALWGVTHVNDGVRALPDTGIDESNGWTVAVASGLFVLAGIALLTSRRKPVR
jgi:LPXTG-motif cell wall-anchored protein